MWFTSGHDVTIRFTIPADSSIFKIVGPGKDVSMPVESVGGATFVNNGPAGAVKADAYFVGESTLVSDSSLHLNRLWQGVTCASQLEELAEAKVTSSGDFGVV